MKTKVIKVDIHGITFDNGMNLSSDHEQDCCESHQLTFTDLTVEDFSDLEFDLSGDSFFRKIPDYGIELVPIKGHSVKIPAHGYNNGYYGTNIDLVITDASGVDRKWDISECQVFVEG